ncbi:MAG: beta-N-acetylglucosaminidase domain-containing protein [Bdellovibrionota bacterium]
MKMGVVEGFFGPAWPSGSREGYASFLRHAGGDFYIYAPKQDQHLRKGWRGEWEESYLDFLRSLSSEFKKNGIQFGVALSPFGLGKELTADDKKLLLKKLKLLTDVGIDMLGMFFDDMPSHENLAAVQAEVIAVIRNAYPGKIIFCPSYYTFDPILEKVFGKMPENYLSDIARLIPQDISMAWTGPKVISPEIPRQHMEEVEKLLKRKPFMWENLFANDGPKNCKFLKLRPFDGRNEKLDDLSEAWGFNMMNQPELSKITFLASKKVLVDHLSPDLAFFDSLIELCTPEFAAFITTHRKTFLEKGLDVLTPEEKASFIGQLSSFPDSGAREIEEWLQGSYIVGSECLTD